MIMTQSDMFVRTAVYAVSWDQDHAAQSVAGCMVMLASGYEDQPR